MRINQFVAQATGLSRRAADLAVAQKRVLIDGEQAQLGQDVSGAENIRLDGTQIVLPKQTTTVILNKPVGYVVSREGQGSRTIYDLLPANLKFLKPIGRLDKDSSGLILLTDDGNLINELLHPRYAKEKKYIVRLDQNLKYEHKREIETGVTLSDGLSALQLQGEDKVWQVTMHEGRNRQIRRTFEALQYKIKRLHRTSFGTYQLGELEAGDWKFLRKSDII